MDIPQDLKYTDNDEWLRVVDGIGEVGITDYAQGQLSDIVYVDVTVSEGDAINKGDAFCTVESVKAAADVYSPVSGTVMAVNEALVDTPELINSDPFGAAWMIKIEVSDPSEIESMLDAVGYAKAVEEKEQ